MLATLAVVLPVFLVILAGWGSVRSGLLGDRVTDGLSEFVFVVAVPILLFRTLATASVPEANPLAYWAAYFAGLGCVWLLASLIAGRLFGIRGAENTLLGFATCQSNTVFVGIPLILRAIGPDGSVPMFLLIAVHLPLSMTVATLLIERSAGSGARWQDVAGKLASHPILVGIVSGALWRLTGLPLPEFLLATTRMIGEAAAPCALFALGMTLRRYPLTAPPAMLGAMVALKLMVQPAIVYVLAFHVVPLPTVWAKVAVLFAACPTGVNAYLLAKRYGAGEALCAATITLSTVAAVATATFWIWFMA
jgi:hypothetical protein